MEREALHAAQVRFSLDLHPSAAGDVMEGIRDQLSSLLLRYSTHLDGVLISYNTPKIISQQAHIHPYFPYFHLDVAADCVIFKPRPGQILDGKVHMVSHDFVGLLMLGLFNVSIGRQMIRADLSHNAIEDCWQSEKHHKHRISVGSAIRFKVDRVDDESEFFTLGGSLLPSGTGEVGFVTAQASKKEKKDKKRRHSEAAATDARVAPQPAAVASPAAPRKAPIAVSSVPVPSASKATNSQGREPEVLSPKKKKRRKQQDAAQQQDPSPNGVLQRQAPSVHGKSFQSEAAKGNTLSAPRQMAKAGAAAHHQPFSNGGASVAPDAAASQPPGDDQTAEKPHKQKKRRKREGAADADLTPSADLEHAKQKSHTKKKGQIDKLSEANASATGRLEPLKHKQTKSSSDKLDKLAVSGAEQTGKRRSKQHKPGKGLEALA